MQFDILRARAAVLRQSLEKTAGPKQWLDGAKKFFGGKALKSFEGSPKPSYPGMDALAEEVNVLKQQNLLKRLTGGLSEVPNVHLQDRAIGGLAGGVPSYFADQAIQGDGPDNSKARSLLAGLTGGYLGGRGVNAIGNVARRWVSNVAPTMGYSIGSIPKPTWKNIMEQGVRDQPLEQALSGGGTAAERLSNPRYELLRRYLGIHTDNAAKDVFQRQRDGTIAFNPATTGPDSAFYKAYLDPALKDPRNTFQAKFQGIDTDVPRAARAPTPEAAPAPAPAPVAAPPAPAVFTPPAGLILPNAPPAQGLKLDLSGQMPSGRDAAAQALKSISPHSQFSTQTGGLALPDGPVFNQKSLHLPGFDTGLAKAPTPEIPKSLHLPGIDDELLKRFKAPEAAPAAPTRPAPRPEPTTERVRHFVPDLEAMQKTPGYNADGTKNPFSWLFGSHDMRHVPGTAKATPTGATTQHEVGDVWNFALDPHERPEFSAYLQGLAQTSPKRWGEYLKQPAALGAEQAYGKDSTVLKRLAQYGTRQATESVLRQNTPVFRQRVQLDYNNPQSHHIEKMQFPAKAEFLPTEAGLAPPVDVNKFRAGGLAGAAGLGGLSMTGSPAAGTPMMASAPQAPIKPPMFNGPASSRYDDLRQRAQRGADNSWQHALQQHGA